MLMVFGLLSPLGSCDKDDDDSNALAYVGTWWRMEDDTPGEEIKQVLDITASTWEMKMQFLEAGDWINFVIIKGTSSETNKNLTLTITEIGVLENPLKMDFYTPSSPEWETVLADIEMPETVLAEYIVAGNTITFIIDGNADGIFDPIEEATTFARL